MSALRPLAKRPESCRQRTRRNTRVPRKQRRVEKVGLEPDFTELCRDYPKLEKTNNRVHLGTLGTGNHFIEVCLDEAGAVWFMLHSGSRGVGNAIGTMFIELAKRDALRNNANLPDRDLAYFGKAHATSATTCARWAGVRSSRR